MSKCDNFDNPILEKINNNFLNDDFFKTFINGKFPDKNREDDSQILFERFLKFANECYIHGVTVGIKVATEIYEEENKE